MKLWGSKRIIGESRDDDPPKLGVRNMHLGKDGVDPGTEIDVNHTDFKWMAEGTVLGPVDPKYNGETHSDTVGRGGIVKHIGRGAYKVRIDKVY